MTDKTGKILAKALLLVEELKENVGLHLIDIKDDERGIEALKDMKNNLLKLGDVEVCLLSVITEENAEDRRLWKGVESD